MKQVMDINASVGYKNIKLLRIRSNYLIEARSVVS